MTLRAIIADDEPLARERIRALLAEQSDVNVIAECGDGREALKAIRTLHPDLVFLDIEMPQLDGFEVVAALDEPLPAIIFITAYDKFAVQAFEVDAIDYLLKPVNAERFAKALTRAAAQVDQPREGITETLHALVERVERERARPARFVVRRGNKLSFVRADEVDWIDGAANYVRLHASGQIHFVRDTLKGVELRLDPASWLRIHRSVLVCLDRVASVESIAHGEYQVVMRDGARLTASRTQSDRLRALLR